MLLIVHPLSFVPTTIELRIHSISFFFIVNLLPFIFFPVRPSQDPFTIHFVVLPLPNVFSTVWPSMFTITLHFVFKELTCVNVFVGPIESSSPMLQVWLPISFIKTSVLQDLKSLAVSPAKLIPLAIILTTIPVSRKRPFDSLYTIGWWTRFVIERLQLLQLLTYFTNLL